MIGKPIRAEGYRLLHDGACALAQVEANGIRIDVPYLKSAQEKIAKRRVVMRKELESSKVWKAWTRRYGSDANMGSNEQLGNVLYKSLGHTPVGFTDTGRPLTNQYALEQLKEPFVLKWLRWKKLGNASGNFLNGILSEVGSDGRLHPFFNLNTVVTYRSSSDSPNFQNMPVRDEEISEIVRRCMIPDKGCVLVENDFKGLEVGVSACYNKDPRLIAYVKDDKLDMHRDMAMELFMLPLEFFLKKLPTFKEIRHSAKNLFVFPQFYGDWWYTCSEYLWEAIERRHLLGPDGKSLYLWLAKHGITSLGEWEPDSGEGSDPEPGTFQHHVMKVERRFWGKRFRVYKKWKRDFYQQYLRRGYFDSYTGFRYEGIFEKNQAVNYPIQGSGFHCLLWSLIQAQRQIRKEKHPVKISGQIHDSMLSNVKESHFDEFNTMMANLIQVRLPKHWDWIVVPMVVETEVCPVGTTWHDKTEVKFNLDMTTYALDGKDYVSSDDLLEAVMSKIETKRSKK